MVFKGIIAGATAIALSTAPAVAAANSPVRAASVAAVQADGNELFGDDEATTGGFIIPLLAFIAVLLGILVATGVSGGSNDGDLRVSP